MIPETTMQAQQVFEPGFFETGSLKDFAIRMEQRGLLSWWRRVMGFEQSTGPR
jgi:hypothetical protein